MTETLRPSAEVSYPTDELFDVAVHLPTYGNIVINKDLQTVRDNFGTVFEEVRAAYASSGQPSEQLTTLDEISDAVRGKTYENSPRHLLDKFQRVDATTQAKYADQLLTMIHGACANDLLDRNTHITKEVETKPGMFSAVEGDVISLITDWGLETTEGATKTLGMLQSKLTHTTYLIHDEEDGASFYRQYGRDATREIVLNATTAMALGDALQEAFKKTGGNIDALQAQGINFDHLGMYWVATHETAHLLADLAKPYAVSSQDWEGIYLFDKPKEAFSPVLGDAIAAEKERFAEGVAQTLLARRLQNLGIPEKMVGKILDTARKSTVREHEELYLLVHKVTDEGLGLDQRKGRAFLRAAAMGYGYPLNQEQLQDRFLYMFDYAGLDGRTAREKFGRLSNIDWRAHTKGARYHTLHKARELASVQEKRIARRRRYMRVGAVVMGLSSIFGLSRSIMPHETSYIPAAEAMPNDPNYLGQFDGFSTFEVLEGSTVDQAVALNQPDLVIVDDKSEPGTLTIGGKLDMTYALKGSGISEEHRADAGLNLMQDRLTTVAAQLIKQRAEQGFYPSLQGMSEEALKLKLSRVQETMSDFDQGTNWIGRINSINLVRLVQAN